MFAYFVDFTFLATEIFTLCVITHTGNFRKVTHYLHRRVSGELISVVAVGNNYEDVFVFEDLVYAMEWALRVVHVYKNRNNSLIKLLDVGYPCACSSRFTHSIIVTNEHIVQCCPNEKLIYVLDRSGMLLRKILIADISEGWPTLRQVDDKQNFLIADIWSNRLVIANANQPSSQWGIVDLANFPDSEGYRGAVWFRHRLYVESDGRLLIFTPVD